MSTTDETVEPAARETVRNETEYVVLKEDGAQAGVWLVAGFGVRARSAQDAVRQYAEKNAEAFEVRAGLLVAIPVRSWNPVEVTTETKTTVKIGGAA